MSTSALITMFALLQLVAIALTLVKSPKGDKLDSAGMTFLCSGFVWLTLAIFMIVDAKTGMKTAELDALLKILGAVVGNWFVFYGMFAWSTRKTK